MLRYGREAPARTFPAVGRRAAGSLPAALYLREASGDGRVGASQPPIRDNLPEPTPRMGGWEPPTRTLTGCRANNYTILQRGRAQVTLDQPRLRLCNRQRWVHVAR